MCDQCKLANRRNIASSEKIMIHRCKCGQYWLVLPNQESGWQANDTELALIEIVTSLVRIKLTDPEPCAPVFDSITLQSMHR